MLKYTITTTDNKGKMTYTKLIEGQSKALATYKREVALCKANVFSAKVEMTRRLVTTNETIVVHSFVK